MKRASVALILSALCLGCSTGRATFNVGGRTVAGADFILCKSRVKWQGLNIAIEGLSDSAPIKLFPVAKVTAKTEEIRELSDIALLIDRWFEDKCNNAILLAPSEQAAYVNKTSDQTLRMLELLVQLAAINRQPINPDSITAQQKAVAAATLSELSRQQQ